MPDGGRRIAFIQGFFAPLQQQVHRGGPGFRPFAQDIRFGYAPGFALGFGQAAEKIVHVRRILGTRSTG